MKRTLLLCILLVAVAAVPAFSFGIGAAFGLDIGQSVGPGALLSFSLDSYPAVFGVGFSANNGFALGATADWWLFYTNLIDILALYIGPGIYLDLALSGGSGSLGIGARVPIGLQAWILDPLEAFLEVAPTLGLKGGDFPAFGVQVEIGARFWF